MLARALRRLGCVSLLFSPLSLWAAIAEEPIYGGLGVTFGQKVATDAYGAEVAAVPESALPDNRSVQTPGLEPGATLPWRHFSGARLPRPLRQLPSANYIMLNAAGEAIRVITRTEAAGCEGSFEWLKTTLSKKYNVQGDPEITPAPPYERALRIEFLARQIEVRCGPRLVMDYMDTNLISKWANAQAKRYALYQREQATIEKRRMVLNRRKSIKFADSFTIGDQYRLEGAFGIQFQRPFAKNSTQKFPVDEPFYAVLPNLPEPFESGEIQLVISPEKHPIVIRGTFSELTFEQIAQALRAKYGTPMKASARHIIHKVSGNHAIVKRLGEDTIEVAFIDTDAQTEQRQRLWDQESEGL